MTTQSADVIIIGGGIVGASIGAALASTHRIVLLEGEDQPGYHATGRSAALFTEAYGPPQVRALTRASRSFFDAPPPAFFETALLHRRGTLFVASAEQHADAEALHGRLHAEGLQARMLDGKEARALIPVLRESASVAAVHDVDAFDVEVDALLQGFLRLLRAGGGLIATQQRVSQLLHDGSLWHVHTGRGGHWTAKTVVNAAGAWADEIAALADTHRIGLEPRRRSAFLFDAPAGLATQQWPAVIAMDESWYFKPDAGLLLGSPANADPVHPHDVVAEELDVAIGIHNIEQATTLQIRRPRSTWAGLRSFVSDGEPVCGYARDVPGFFWAAALGGYGIQTAPAFGELAAAVLRGEAVPGHIVAQGLRCASLAPERCR